MSIKGKLILIGICIVIVITIFTVNVVRRINEKNENGQENNLLQEDVITRAEAYRLLSYLEYDRYERASLPKGFTYSKEDMSGWYDTFVNAVWKMGLIDLEVTQSPADALSYGECKELIDRLIMNNPAYQAAYSGISFDFTRAANNMPVQDFLELYAALTAILPEKDQKLKEETLLVLGSETAEDGTNRMITNTGKYYYDQAANYVKYYEELIQEVPESDSSDNNSADSAAQVDAAADNTAEDNKSDSIDETADQNSDLAVQFLDKGIKALVCGQELVYIYDETTEQIVLHNVWIEKGEGVQLNIFTNDIEKSLSAKAKLSQNIEKVIGDITIEGGKVVKILQKPDIIQGKVLQTGEDFIEIEGYGKVPLDEEYKIYRVYGKLSMEPTTSILVGYENTDFVVSSGRISAALITQSIKAQNIRVLLRTNGYQGYYHDKVELTATSDFTISNKDINKSYKKGDKVTIEPGDELLSEGRVKVASADEDAKIELLSLKRSDASPKYRGTIEIAQEEEGLLVVNELPLEEYLYAIVPSEMPTYYGLEALKVQAVCARSYAYRHLVANSLSQYGAHVDDSVGYQVYNSIPENEDSILAVKDTYGKVIEYNGEVITAYYFSTSCGHTAKASEVWAYDVDYPYLEGKLLAMTDAGEDVPAGSGPEVLYEDLSSEDSFRSFIEETVPTTDSDFSWYRWKVTIEAKELKQVIDQNLAGRYNANPQLILTKTGKEEETGKDVFESIPVDTAGDIVDISVLKRESSGIISELLITGSKNTIRVKTEYNIRALLAPIADTIVRQDDSKVENLSLLPSAFFLIDKEEKSGKISSITLNGGGYGHGVGMSQNGVKTLADAGEDYESIVKYFYEGIEMGFIYE